MLPTIDKLLVKSGDSIKQVLRTIDPTGQRIGFVVDDAGVLIGVLSDGDIRRALINEATLETPAGKIMNTRFVSFPVGTSPETLLKHLSPRISHIPLVDKAGRPVDYASLSQFNRFPVSMPFLAGKELEYVTNCIHTNWISSQGKYVKDFEMMVAAYCQVPYAAAVSNGTVALHLGLLSLDIGPGDEVIVPDLTFAASINAVIHAGATPVMVDVERDSWNISPQAVEAAITPRTRAIMPVHLYGLCARMDAIGAIARRHGLYIIEDAAEAMGSSFQGQPAGSFGDVATFSFFGNKTITTGEGGMVLFKDKRHYEKALELRDHGMSKTKRYWHNQVGYNYRLTNLQAALGVAQMERIDQIVARKVEIGEKYRKELSAENSLQLPMDLPEARNTYWLFTVLLKENAEITRDELIQRLLQNGIETRPVFYPLHQMPPYRHYVREKDFPNSNWIAARGLCLPSYLSLEDHEITMICKVLNKQVHPMKAF